MANKTIPEQLWEITKSTDTLNEESSKKFLKLLHTYYPNDTWKHNQLVKESVIAFEWTLLTIDEQWAKDRLALLINLKAQRGDFASSLAPKASLRPHARPSDPITPHEHMISTKEAQEIINSHTDTPIVGKNLEWFTDTTWNEITSVKVVTLAIEIIGQPLTHQTIKDWQKEHGIESDGKIGQETYCEMYAEKVKEQAQYKIEEYGITPKTQKEIMWVLENGNLNGRNMIALQIFLQHFEAEHKHEADFNTRYWKFFENTTKTITEYQQSPEWQQALQGAQSTRTSDGRSFYEVLKDDSMTPVEKIKYIASDPMVLIGWWIMFLFWVFGNSKKWNNTFLKRAGVLLWAIFLWPTLLNKIGLDDMWEDFDWTKRVNNLLSFGSTSRERLEKEREREGSELGKVFGSNEFFTKVQDYFASSPELGSIPKSELPRYIEALKSGKNIPDFLQGITVDGKVLTTEQVRVYLETLQGASSDQAWTTITELLQETSPIDMVWGGLSFAAIWVWMYATWPLITAVGVGSWIVLGTKKVVEWMREDSELSNANKNLQQLVNEITQKELKNILIEISNSESGLTSKISRINELSKTYPNLKEIFQKIIDNLIIIYVRPLIIQSESEKLSNEDKQLLLETLQDAKEIVGQHISNEDTKVAFLSSIEDTISLLSENIENERQTFIRERVQKIENDIQAQKWHIAWLERKKQQLLEEKNTATAERIIEIDKEISEIEWKILESSQKINTLEKELVQAKVDLANLELEATQWILNNIDVYLHETLPSAIEVQGIVQAWIINFSTISSLSQQLESISQKIEIAPESKEKSNTLTQIKKLQADIQKFIDTFKDNFKPTESVTIDANIDFTDKLQIDAIKSILESQRDQNIDQKMSDFYGVEFQSLEEIRNLYKHAFEEKLQTIEEQFISTPAQEIKILKEIKATHHILTQNYHSLFWENYNTGAFNAEIQKKQEEIYALRGSSIPEFSNAFTNMIDATEWLTVEQKDKFKSKGEKTISDMMTFFTNMKNQGIVWIDDTIETTILNKWEKIINTYIIL